MRVKTLAFMLIGVCTSAFTQESGTAKYKGLSDYRFVKSLGGDTRVCGQNAWIVGNFFSPPADRSFTRDDSITIKLKAARFPYVPEPKTLFGFEVYGKEMADRAQIGIFADVKFEGDVHPTPGTVEVPGRLVLYDDDYAPGQQRLDTTGINVFGPSKYPGGGLSLRLTYLEFDRDLKDAMQDTMLQAIAELGETASRGLAPSLVGPISNLSKAALSIAKSKDDIFGYKQLVLDGPSDPTVNPNTVPLISGDVVFIRKANRGAAVDWNNLCFNPSTGVVSLDKKTKGSKKEEPIEEEPIPDAYLTLAFFKNLESGAGALTSISYDDFVRQKFSSNSDTTSLVSASSRAVDGLKTFLIQRQLESHFSLVKAGERSYERSSVSWSLARALYASSPPLGGRDGNRAAAKIARSDPRCQFLLDDQIGTELYDEAFMRLEYVDPTKKAVKLMPDSAPKNCDEALAKVKLLKEGIFSIAPPAQTPPAAAAASPASPAARAAPVAAPNLAAPNVGASAEASVAGPAPAASEPSVAPPSARDGVAPQPLP